MIADVDIWRTANVLMKEHGDYAVVVAAQRADELMADADVDGFFVWLAVVKAINELHRRARGEDDAVN